MKVIRSFVMMKKFFGFAGLLVFVFAGTIDGMEGRSGQEKDVWVQTKEGVIVPVARWKIDQ